MLAPEEPEEIRYEIDVRESRLRDQLIIDFSSGGRPLCITEADVSGLKSADRALLGLLLGNVAEERNRAHLQKNLTFSRSVVRPGMYDLVLIRLVESRRFFVDGEPVEYDLGDPFGLVLSVSDEGDTCALRGRLTRDDETIDLGAPSVLLSGGIAIVGSRIIAVDTVDFDWMYRLHRQGPITVPRDQADEMLLRLSGMPDLPELELPESLSWKKKRIAPRPGIVFSPSEEGAKIVYGNVELDYGGQVVSASSKKTSVADESGRRLFSRDRRAERKHVARLRELGFLASENAHFELPSKALTGVIRTLVDEGWSIEADGAQVRATSKRLEPRVSSGIDWFDLEAELDYDGITVSLPELLEAAASGKGWVQLSDGSRGLLPDWLKDYAPLCRTGKREGDRLRFLPSQAGIIDALLTGHEDAADVKFDRVRKLLKERSRPAKEPGGFFGKLRGYQKKGLAWLQFLENARVGGCLADDMGLGKTVQVLASLLARHQKAKTPSLIVVPKSLVGNWIKEAAKFTPSLKVHAYVGSSRKKVRLMDYDLLVTTYGTLRHDVLDLLEIKFTTVILDEAQAIKNPRSQAAKACRLIRSEHRLAITGTPIENSLDELWSIFEFLNPGMLGTFDDFSANGRDADDGWLDMLSRSLQPLMLRRTKEQVLKELPKKTEQVIEVELSSKEQEAYDELLDYYRGVLSQKIEEVGFGRAKIHVLEALLRLRQAACHPGLIDADRMDAPSSKVDALMEKLEEVVAAGHKALVFSQFTTLLEIVRRRLEKSKIRHAYLDGQTRDRQGVCDDFQSDPGLSVFLISLKAGGCGLNLTASDYVFILDPWWNPAVESQAIDRSHRMGQKNPVFAYRLITSGTVEEKIVALKAEKKKLADAIVSVEQVNGLLE